MMLNTGEKLASIQTKIHSIQERLESGKLYSAASSCSDLSCADGALKPRRSFFVHTLEKQTFYAHCCKILFLLALAIVHLVYLQPFLDVYSTVDDYSTKLRTKYPTETKVRGLDTRFLEYQVDVLSDYKKNIWMTIASMCVALSTSCFFLFLLPTTKLRRTHIILMGLVDLVAFATLPALLVTRGLIVDSLNASFPKALQLAHKVFSAERLMNTLQCTINPREQLPFCAEIVLKSIFPVVLLKFLLVLALFTLAYIGLAYLIEYCIRHWFPHASSSCVHATSCHQCSHCNCYRRYEGRASVGNYKRTMSCTSLRSAPLLRQYKNKTYVPVLIPQAEPFSAASLAATLQPIIALQPSAAPADAPTEPEPIPAEPQPSEPIFKA